MKWLIGIAAVMMLMHLYFTWGQRRLERKARQDSAEDSQEKS